MVASMEKVNRLYKCQNTLLLLFIIGLKTEYQWMQHSTYVILTKNY